MEDTEKMGEEIFLEVYRPLFLPVSLRGLLSSAISVSILPMILLPWSRRAA